MKDLMELLDLSANYHTKTKLLFEELRADFGNCLLEEARRSNHVHALDEAGKEALKMQ